MYKDTYFLDSKEALRVASEHNRWGVDVAYNLQACYYDGQKIESDLPNLFHLPIENLLEGLVYGRERIPEIIDFSGLDISSKVKMEILTHFDMTIEQAKQYRVQINSKYLSEIKNFKLDFSEPLRFYLMANDQTTVMQFVSKSIADTLKEKGCDVLFDLYRGTEDITCFKKIYEYKPHVTININHLNNRFLGNDVFNFVWFQDPMEHLVDSSDLYIRNRDYIFSLLPAFDMLLEKKSIPFQRQNFCIDSTKYKIDKTVKREKKIVFIGSAYHGEDLDRINVLEVIDYIMNLFQNGESFSNEKMDEIVKKFSINKTFLETRVMSYIVRDLSVLWLCSIKSDYEVEVYGWGWDSYEAVRPYYKGVLKYGEEIAKVYNSAAFAFAPHFSYALQNRVLEATACGAIPIVYDRRGVSDEPVYDEAMYYFKTFEDLRNILMNNKIEEKDFSRLLEEHSYVRFVDKILDTIQKSLQNE
ncbi:MAG: hypothetical protein A2513_05395 [Sulfurimonas sp. RIFOXYD12_FULL_33_39]|uniref:glycosyltransferase family protein n=1 Tax=unclassified Sulfurimonas TaxID=2623549 RepID=UPI0008B32099|nr:MULTISPECIES: glycosyltransferase [unclassified Sulfurimonas]OHE10306.1 MAG: hypothetical protein A2513_05395 [Sulfurimonas sp. RIFOXYD12_FULL_33_39]OHE13118.1 MAG: hypothetical protein A2530_11560 [Sulfurimonas sp. RIFOXYD2_FULL_34_21]